MHETYNYTVVRRFAISVLPWSSGFASGFTR